MTLTVCSERFILTTLCPLAWPNAITRLVLPTPGVPSNKIGLYSCKALNNRRALHFGPVADNEYLSGKQTSLTPTKKYKEFMNYYTNT